MILTYSLLAATALSLWFTGEDYKPGLRRDLWLVLFLAALISGLATGVVTGSGLVVVLLFALACFYLARTHVNGLRIIAGVLVFGFSVALMLHRLPGFHNALVIDAARFTPDAVPFTLYLNFDKTLIGLFILGWGYERIVRASDWSSMLKKTVVPAVGLIVVVMVLSLAMGYVRLAPKWPADTWLWLGVNLLFTCLAEEAFFRGFIQKELAGLWSRRTIGPWIALVVAALLFGLAHFSGGASYVGLATVAGLGYGWIYQRTQRIEASILAHFLLNTVHFLLFTYPALAR